MSWATLGEDVRRTLSIGVWCRKRADISSTIWERTPLFSHLERILSEDGISQGALLEVKQQITCRHQTLHQHKPVEQFQVETGRLVLANEWSATNHADFWRQRWNCNSNWWFYALFFVKQVLHSVYHTYIFMMTAFCEKVCHACVGFIHEIVNNYQPFISPIKTTFWCKTLNKLNSLDFFKAVLPLSTKSYNLRGHIHFSMEFSTNSVYPLHVGFDTAKVNGCANRTSIVIKWVLTQINDNDKFIFFTLCVSTWQIGCLLTLAAQCKQAQMCIQGANKLSISWS